ncbi:ceramide synthase 1-like [Tubulanus polymorphus]|uniref:ceramide synthase 1-like n=1 Tax=Tubulanus polymorphus TaxID=672921 RepID=UPI003DA3E5E7
MVEALKKRWIETSQTDQGNYLSKFIEDVRNNCVITREDYILMVVLALLWTILRYAFQFAVFKPFAKLMGMKKINQYKFAESAWKEMFYFSTWFLTIYILFIDGRYDYFTRHLSIWKDWSPQLPVPALVYWLYMIQLSFYIHSVYGTLFMDQWRSDSIVMLFHHFLTLCLIAFSHANRFFKIGVLVFFVHDGTDILLEFAKCNVYMKDRGGFWKEFHDKISAVVFVAFTISWFVLRLYWFPLKVVYSGTVGSVDNHTIPFYFFLNIQLYILQALNIYWFCYIVLFLIKVVTGELQEMEDIREEEVLEKINNKHTVRDNGARQRKTRTKKEN